MNEDTPVFHMILDPKFNVKLKESMFIDSWIFYPPDLAGLWLDPKIFFVLQFTFTVWHITELKSRYPFAPFYT